MENKEIYKKGSMRLDRYVASQSGVTRSEAIRLIKSGCVTVDGIIATKPNQKLLPCESYVILNGNELSYQKHVYIIMNKPPGVLSASRDSKAKTVLDLLPENLKRRGLFPAGRLDKYTTGLLIITNDGDYAHKMLSPKKHVWKLYQASLANAVSEQDIKKFEEGISYGTENYKPAQIELKNDTLAMVKVQEGRYHQVKRMFEACNNKVIELKRLSIGNLNLPKDLALGESRVMSTQEAAKVFE